MPVTTHVLCQHRLRGWTPRSRVWLSHRRALPTTRVECAFARRPDPVPLPPGTDVSDARDLWRGRQDFISSTQFCPGCLVKMLTCRRKPAAFTKSRTLTQFDAVAPASMRNATEASGFFAARWASSDSN